MCQKVSVQMSLLTECLLTLFTFEWFLTRVSARVSDEVLVPSEALAALIALMLLLGLLLLGLYA